MNAIYELIHTTKWYHGRPVLHIDQLSLFAGEIFAVIGPSGAGKSTLLRLLNFLEAPTSGEIHFRNACFSAHQAMPLALRRQITTVFQRPALLHRSVAANVRYGLQLRGMRHTDGAIRQALQRVGLDQLAHQPAHTLSGGEAQRVALARAMVVDPAVLLLDEPTANLDPYNVKLIEESVLQLNREAGCTVVIVTHNLFQAHRLANRVGLLLEGRMVEVNATEQFFETPSDPRTAAFIRGEMVY